MLLTGIEEIDLKIKKEIASSSTLKSTHQIIAEWNYNAYTDIDSIGCSYFDGTDWKDDPNEGKQTYYYSEDLSETDLDRETYTPLKSIFEINRPNPGIINGIYCSTARDLNIIGDTEAGSLSLSRIFNMKTEHSRLYPLSKNSVYKYWNSYRLNNKISVGISQSIPASGVNAAVGLG
ncbi:MAG: hypothetical protein EB127_17630 [Alphaproteobacteria bacterium]|nr:hypothetical protein [Alphaproteobacteria bacterium]